MKKFIVVIALLVISVSLNAQDFEAPIAQERIASWLDYAAYKIDNYPDFALVEFYYGMLRSDLTYEDFDTILDANAFVWLEIYNEKGKVVDTLNKTIGTRLRDRTQVDNKSIRILDALQALIRPGEYSVKLIIEDANSQIDGQPFTGKVGERQIKITVPDFQTDDLNMSSIELAYKIEMLKENDSLAPPSPLDKNSRHVTPNPSRIFINDDSLMYFYAEVYNLKFGKDLNRNYEVRYEIQDLSGSPIADFGSRSYFKPGSSAIISSAIDISDLPEGKFNFYLEVTDNEDQSQVSSTKEFTLLYSTDEIAPAVSAEQFTEDDAELMAKMIKYFASDNEMETYKNADLNGKKEFLKIFWQSKDPIPSTRLNEFKAEVFKRFRYANERFSLKLIDRSDGWSTDRGRVYIQYGEPDEIEQYPSSPRLEPYERWIYYNMPRQGMVFFIFVDETGFGDYVLKHSTAQGEITDYEWEQLLQTTDPFKSGY